MRVYFVYNSPPWVIRQLTINDLDTLWDIPLLMQDNLEELYQTLLLGGIVLSVPGETLLLASDYLISSRIRGGWCSMSHIDQDVEVRG